MKLAQDPDSFEIRENQPYAELWLGAHPNGMSKIVPENRALSDYVAQDSQRHCGKVSELTFLFKVLSIEKVLSIQAHPDKACAERLHRDFSSIYKDPNHKPEMAIALSPSVRAMCGFRPADEILANMKAFPEFITVVGPAFCDELRMSPESKSVLQMLFQSYLECHPAIVQTQLTLMLDRMASQNAPHNELESLILKLAGQFPGDAGIFSPLLLNVLEFSKGQALYIGANEPHAYIGGEILECMACSDNVVRAGLTPKHKDVKTLVDMLTYNTDVPALTSGVPMDRCTRRYQPPVADFCVETIVVPSCGRYTLKPVDSPSILLVLEGDGNLVQGTVTNQAVGFGYAGFVSANTGVDVLGGREGIRLTRAFSNVFHEGVQE